MAEKIPHNRAQHERERMRSGVDALLRADIPDQYKVLALLAFTGEKPLSEWNIPYREEYMDSIQKVRHALSSFGVPYKENIISNHGGQRIHFSIARDPVVLEQLNALNAHPHTKHSAAWHERYGNLLGFPKTSIHAFLHHKDAGMIYAPDEIKHTDIGRFIDLLGGFRLSSAHWREEIKTVQKWMDSIRAVSPSYLNHLLSDTNDHHSGTGH